MQQEAIRKQANDIVEKARQQGKILDSDSLKKQLLQKISSSGNTSDEELGEKNSDTSINLLTLRKNKSKERHLNPNPKGLLKGILAIVPEEINVVYLDN